jgi:DNA-binding transcriptional LysR family regulator
MQCGERRTRNDRQSEASADWNTAIPFQPLRFQAARFFPARQSPCGYRNVGEQLIGLLTDRRVDAILTIFDADSASKFPSRVLFEEPYVLAVPESHRFAQRKSVKLSDLRGEPFIVRARCDRYHDVTDALNSHGVELRVMYKTDQDDRALALVAAGVGLALFPAHFEMPAVKKVAVSDLGLSRVIGLLWARDREDDLTEFIKFAESHSWRYENEQKA